MIKLIIDELLMNCRCPVGVCRAEPSLQPQRQAALASDAGEMVPGRRLSSRGSRFQVGSLQL